MIVTVLSVDSIKHFRLKAPMVARSNLNGSRR